MDLRVLAASALKAQFKGLEIEEIKVPGLHFREKLCLFKEIKNNRVFVVADLQKHCENNVFYEIYKDLMKGLPGFKVLFCLVTFKDKVIIYEFSESDSIQD